jgi:hypothetical protein
VLVRKLKRQQERLGRLQDLQMLLRDVREIESAPPVPSNVNDLTAFAEIIDKDCRRLHADFIGHRGELAAVVKEVRHQIVPALTTFERQQAHASPAAASAIRTRARAK